MALVRPLEPAEGLLLMLGRLVLALWLERLELLLMVGRLDMLPEVLLLAPVPMRPDMLPAVA